MPSQTLSTDIDWYRYPPTSKWYSYDNNTEGVCAVYAGVSGAGNYIAAVHFPLAGYPGIKIDSATLTMKRFCNESTTAKTLIARIGTINTGVESAGNYAFADGNTVGWSISAGAGDKSLNVTSLMPALLASDSHYLLIYGDSGDYTEFCAREEGASYAARLAFNYHYPLCVNVGGGWRNVNIGNCKINVNGGWRAIAHMQVNAGGAWYTIY